VKASLLLSVLFLSITEGVVGGATPSTAPHRPFEIDEAAVAETQIDRIVFGRLSRLRIKPAYLCSDAVFIRRAFLDVIGTLPTAQETRDFLADRSPNKRVALIDRLLARPEFVDYWAMKWGDILRIKAEFPINLWPNAAQAYHRWVLTSIRDNKTYDRFARELLTASGSNFRVGQVNFYRAVQSKDSRSIAQAVALTLMGERAEKWPAERLSGMAGFFSRIGYKSTAEWKEEVVFFDAAKSVDDTPAVFPDGIGANLPADKDPREVFADWLIQPNNQWFARNIVNRVWCWLLGRGIIHEPDDIRPDNPPVNPALLAYLERQLIANDYDLKHIYRLILTSRTYQLSSIARSQDSRAAENFAACPLRRLEAEVLIDALCQLTGTTEQYTSAIPEPFTFIPPDQRSIALPDGSITSSPLDMFGRPARDSGLESERNNRPTADQQLFLLNSSHVQRKLEQGKLVQSLIRSRRNPRDIATELYLTILSRFPTDEELTIAEKYALASGAKGRAAAVIDLAWALINSDEFLYRH
jgi:hypothetical protein